MMNQHTIYDLELEKCTGCYACLNACRFQAIEMREDAEGFLFPFIREDLCAHCGMCAKSCPALNVRHDNSRTPRLYAARASNEIRAVSSSGGVFTVLAKEILGRGGLVCGAAFDENMTVRHILVDKEDDLQKLRGSKYVQSAAGLIYRDIEEALKAGRYVLFTGSPCQAAALKAYLQKPYETLYEMDILCHGVPSDKVFHQYLAETVPGKRVVDVRFRDKRNGWTANYIIIRSEDGGEYVGEAKKDFYLKGFLRNAILRKSCGNCPFSEFPRQGDISVGDFWGITRLDKSQHDGRGTSLVYVNSPKGEELWNAVASQMKVKAFDFKSTEIKNRIHASFPINANRDRVLKFMGGNPCSYSRAIQTALPVKYDIGLVSNFYAGNFGGSLTQYALYHVLEDMGYSCLMIEHPADAAVKASLKTMGEIYLEFPYPPTAIAAQYRTRREMAALNKLCNTFVVGSDQLFQYSLFNAMGGIVTLDWVDSEKKKIAYAASYGHANVWGDANVLAEMGFFMRRFDAFSVREKTGVQISREKFGIDAEWALDPVFLCNPAHYASLIRKSKRKVSPHYIGGYILDPSESKAEIFKMCQNALDLKAHIFSEFSHTERYVQPLSGLDVQHLKMEERLQLIENCDFFVTDSFHGTCFAIIYRKPFVTVLNKKRGASRFESIFPLLGLEDRLLKENELPSEELFKKPIDWESVYSVLNRERDRCLQWLKDAIEREKPVRYTDYDVLIRLIRKQQAEIERLKTLSGLGFESESQLSAYIQELRKNLSNYVILISVKDTPGLALSAETAKELQSIGIRSTLSGQHWKSYVAAINGGDSIYEELSPNRIQVTLRESFGNIALVSANWKSGNAANILLNGRDYSVNGRGLNIVVIHKNSGCVLDSVCFDTHMKGYPSHRLENIDAP